MSVELTVLCDDNVQLFSSLIGKHGFACFIETDNGNYLFDTGQGSEIIHNALVLNKDLRSIESITLSHGHYDHTSGLDKVLEIIGKKKIYAHPDIFSKRYDDRTTEPIYIGIRYVYEYLVSAGAEFLFNKDFKEIGPNVYISGEVPRITDFENNPDGEYVIDKYGNKKLDPFLDDCSIAIDTPKGLVILLGCAHAGIINILKYFQSKLKKNIYAVLGGTHLHPASEERFQKTIEALKKFDIQHLGTSHCTGPKKEADLYEEFKEKYFFAPVGTKLIIED